MITQKLWAIKPHHWPWTEFSSSGQRLLWFSKNLPPGGLSGILQDKVKMLGALVLCPPSKHIFCCTLLTLWCVCVNEWHALREANEEPCSAVLGWSHKAYGRNAAHLLMSRGNQCLLQGAARDGSFRERPERVWTELPFLSQTFLSLWPFHDFLGIRTTNLICQIIDFQGTCDLCCYRVLLFRSQTWIGSQEAPSLPRSRKFGSSKEL